MNQGHRLQLGSVDAIKFSCKDPSSNFELP
jgi:hypothetical protein